MVDKDLMDVPEQEDVYTRDGIVETVIGGGRVGIVAAAFEARQQRVLVAGTEQGLIRGGPDAMPVSRGEAARGMQNLEQRAADAIAGTALQTAKAMDRLADHAATAV